MTEATDMDDRSVSPATAGHVDSERYRESNLSALRSRLKFLIAAPLGIGVLAGAGSLLIPPTFTGVTTFMVPQQTQGGAAAALASLGSLAQLAGGSPNLRSSGEQLVALMQSVTVSDRLIEQFKLMDVYNKKYRVEARKELAKNVRMSVGKKDAIITLEADDTDPKRASAIANQYVEELRRITDTLAVTEAQQRRIFFEGLLKQSRDRLVSSQRALQGSGYSQGALKVEPKAAAESYARLMAEFAASEVRLQTLRGTLADGTTEVQQQQARLGALREQLARTEQPTRPAGDQDYVSKFREFKYQETLFELYARQFELASVDESREGALIQVVDLATPPEKKSKPRHALIAAASTLIAALLLSAWVVMVGAGRRREP